MSGVSARRQSGAHTVALLTGYGVSLTVDHGALVLSDGIANQRRQTRLHRGQRTLKRIVVLSATGNLSLAALRWCADVGIAVTCIDQATEDVLLVCAPRAHDDARIRRAQALAGDSPLGLTLAKELIFAKVRDNRPTCSRSSTAPMQPTAWIGSWSSSPRQRPRRRSGTSKHSPRRPTSPHGLVCASPSRPATTSTSRPSGRDSRSGHPRSAGAEKPARPATQPTRY
jgi:hypothetical protein